MTHYVIDTNVLVKANEPITPETPLACADRCARHLDEITDRHVVVVDREGEILAEYRRRVIPGHPLPGSKFLKWLYTVQYNDAHWAVVDLDRDDDGGYTVFPDDPDLHGFHDDDRKFAAAALAHASRPHVLNAVDSDWWDYQYVLARHGVIVDQLCPEHFGRRRRSRKHRGRDRSGGPRQVTP